MKTKRLFATILSLILTFALAYALISCGGETPAPEEPKKEACTAHSDNNGDNKCDKCGAAVEAPECAEHKDEDGDNKCDACDFDMTPKVPECEEHKDEDGDNKCDVCDADVTPEAPECTEHKDEDGDNKCDACDFDMTPAPSATEVSLIEGGKGKFSFVVASGYSGEVNKAILEITTSLEKIGIEVETLQDTKDTVTACEVLVGSVGTRGDQYKIDEHSLGYEGYIIRLIDGKVLILGGSESALLDAIAEFKKDILGLTKKTPSIDSAVMTAEKNVEKAQDNYAIKSVTVADNDLRDYVITTSGQAEAIETANAIQEHFYKKLGIWLKIVDFADGDEKIISIIQTDAKTCSSEKGFIAKVEDGNVVIDCGFKNKIKDATLAFIMAKITNQKTESVTLAEGLTYEKEDYKNIYYADFGAKGDGYTDDFYAIKACHDEANKYGNTVNANSGKNYYIGIAFLQTLDVIKIKTDVNWTGAKFTIDDSILTVERLEHKDADGDKICDRSSCKRSTDDVCLGISTGWHTLNLFQVVSDYGIEGITGEFAGRSLDKSATNIGYAPGYKALVKVMNENVKQFIRYGVNQNAGNPMQEVVLVDEDGNIDPSTPLHWSYEVITFATVKRIDDEPITIEGGEFTNIANQAANYYDSYGRNIYITRANVTAKNMKHELVDQKETRAPYAGFLRVQDTYNVLFDNIVIQHHTDTFDAQTGALLGTYELGGRYSIDITWRNITQTNFFEEDGSLKGKGLFGSNYCKNLNFENCFMSSMDAHCGVYNVNISNSTFEHMNFIGEGLIHLKNVTVYAQPKSAALVFRADYGATWNGTVKIEGLTIKYENEPRTEMALISASYQDWWFGYDTYLPHTIEMDNVRLVKFTHNGVGGSGEGRVETEVAVNAIPLYLYPSAIYSYKDKDISELIENGGDAANNPYHGTEVVKVTNCGDLTLKLPKTPQFKNLKYYVDGVQQIF